MSRRKSLFQRLYLPFLILILSSILAVGWYGIHAFREFSLSQLTAGLESQAHLVRHALASELTLENREAIDHFAKEMGKTGGIRVTIVLKDGTVIGDSHADPRTLDNHLRRPEIGEALQGRTGSSLRFSHTIDVTMHYVSVPIIQQGEIVGAVRTSVELTAVNEAMRGLYIRMGMAALIIAGLAIITSLFVAQRLRLLLQSIRQGAERFAMGDLKSRLPVPRVDELAALSVAMNKMARQLDERIRAIIDQREEQEAVLAGMIEGVIAIDKDERVIIANNAAARMFEFNTESAKGRFMQEVVRNDGAQRFVKKALTNPAGLQQDIILLDNGDRILQAGASPLRGPQNSLRGTVVVFNDITRMRKLEMTRREFVANVSHELKTPITSIKGFVETLRDGQPMSTEESERFLGIIARQADQLTATIDDLLDLARIEREADTDQVRKELTPLRVILLDARTTCERAASENNVEITVACDRELEATVNARLMEQALVNLIDNAIKYGRNKNGEPPQIHVSALRENGWITFRVKDNGPGIPAEHVPRLFERFYRVDRSRAREYGGTGLGLAIVKHIALAHGGSAGVSTEHGKGSTFTIRIPAR